MNILECIGTDWQTRKHLCILGFLDVGCTCRMENKDASSDAFLYIKGNAHGIN
jgi:hypothetical protein